MHVAGIIRIDAIRPLLSSEPDFDGLIGKECRFDSPEAVWRDACEHPEDFLPMGSEGSLRKSVWVNPSESSMAAYTVSVFGDLRDFDASHEIVEWFKEVCDGLCVRNAVITVEDDFGGFVTWTFPGKAA